MLNSKGQQERLDVAKKDRRRRNHRNSAGDLGLPGRFAGALVAATGEIWPFTFHLQLSTRAGPQTQDSRRSSV